MTGTQVPLPSRWHWLWPIALAAAIWVASSRSRVAAPDLDFIAIDKITHFAVFGLLASLTVRMRRGWRFAAVSVLAVSAYGVVDEWHQSFTPGREVEVADWIADTSGAILAVCAYRCWPGYRALLERPLRGRRRAIEQPSGAGAS